MEVNITYSKEIEEYIDSKQIKYELDKSVTKGLCFAKSNEIFINLDSGFWKILLSLEPESFEEELSNTITHELIHLEIENNKDFKIEYPKEEYVCEIMANQRVDLTSTRIETFK